jgi:hypothetical protein
MRTRLRDFRYQETRIAKKVTLYRQEQNNMVLVQLAFEFPRMEVEV